MIQSSAWIDSRVSWMALQITFQHKAEDTHFQGPCPAPSSVNYTQHEKPPIFEGNLFTEQFEDIFFSL